MTEKEGKKVIYRGNNLGRKIDLGKKKCPFCNKMRKTFGYDDVRGRDGRLVQYTNHSCPNIEPFERLI